MPQGNASSLYDPSFEHDSCGFGLIANIDGRASAWLIDQAFATLAKMSHRGGIGADGITGDGCGMLLYRPFDWLRALAGEADIALAERFASGHVFLDPGDAAHAAAQKVVLEQQLRVAGLHVAGWREVPVDATACGPIGAAHRPRIAQIFVDAPAGMDEATFDRALFRARRLTEKALTGDTHFYVVTLCATTFAAKAMVAPGQLRAAFPDFSRPDLSACAAVFHQRFSTNTMPHWRLAQPFRLLAHNGEINTIKGNRNWATARAAKYQSPLVELSDIGPLVSLSGSDSESLDNMLEVLVAGGLDVLV
ncbi:MAG: hypothetical protein ACREES_10515, partial [Stellaceae bacterium]